MKNEKILIIGLDGVDFGLLEYLVKNDITPNLAGLCKNGARGRLLSRPPLQTPATWTTFITGKNAGRHGIYGFFAYNNNSYELKVLNSLERKSQALWHILNRHGKTVGIFNMPSLFPPEKIDGYMVCGMLAPNISCNFTYPRGLKERLFKAVKDYEIDIGMTMSAKDSRGMLLEKTYEITEKRVKAAQFLLKEFPCDLTILIFTETDRIEHFFLKDMGGASRYKDVITDYFKFLDKRIGELIEKVDKETTIIVMSDHGMAPFRKVFYVNNFLKEMGLASEEKRSIDSMRHSFVEGCFKVFVDFMVRLKVSPENLKRFIPQWLFNRLTVILGHGGGFDWFTTKAFFSSSIGDGIMINLKGRQPKGIVGPDEYEKIRDQIIIRLRTLKDPDTNEGIVEGAYKREELFSGDFVDNAPDIILKLKDGYIPHSSTVTSGILESENPLGPIGSDHTSDAMLIMHGDRIKKAILLEKAGMPDLAPTILKLMRIPMPPDLDGRVLSEALKEDDLDAGISGDAAHGVSEEDKAGLTEEEEKQVRATLKKLGYLKDE